MSDLAALERPLIGLVRHGETTLALQRRYNGRPDIPLTSVGAAQARRLAPFLATVPWDGVLASPLSRVRRTAELAGFPDPEIVPDLIEMDCGECEALTTEEVRLAHPGWNLWRDGFPDGETFEDVLVRLEPVIARLSSEAGAVLVFSHSLTLRVLAAVWLGQPPRDAEKLPYGPARVSVLGVHRGTPTIQLWNGGPG